MGVSPARSSHVFHSVEIRTPWRLGTAAVLLMGSTSLGVAQTLSLPEISVISPTTIPTPLSQIPNSVTVITKEDIEREQRRTAPDVLSTVPGLNIVQSGGPGGQTSIFLRGTNSNHTKVLIDGIDVSDPSNPNRSFDFGTLTTFDIDRVEVLRGPQSGLYGSDAVGGVVSFTTRKGEGPPTVYGLAEGGTFNTRNFASGFSGSQDRFNYTFNVSNFHAETPVTPFRLLPPGQPELPDRYDNTTAATRLGYDLSEYVSFNYFGRYTDATLKFNSNPGDTIKSTQEVHQFFTRGEGIVRLFENRFINTFGVNYTDHWNWNQTQNGIPTVNKGDRTREDWRGVWYALPGQTVVMGAEHEEENLRTATVRATTGYKAAYAEYQSQWFERFFLVANGRVDDNDSFGEHWTYRVAPAYIVPVTETKIKGSVATGFKAPTLNQLFVSFPAFNFFANPNLLPEEVFGYDAGLEQPFFNDRVRVGATYFHNDITNLITTASIPIGTTLVNVNQATTEGVEAFAAAIISPELRVRGDYTFVRSIDEKTGLELLRQPKHKVSATAIWTPDPNWTISATVLHVSDWQDIDRVTFATITQPGYTVVNVATNYTINKYTSAFARIDNLFNERYENPNGFERPGFGIFGGIRVAASAVDVAPPIAPIIRK